MLSLLFFHIIVTLICTLAGVFFYSLINVNRERHLIFFSITGLIIITLIAQIVALFAPLSIPVFLVVTGVILAGCFQKQKFVYQVWKNFVSKTKKHSLVSLLLIAAVWLMILVMNAGPTLMDDTESYHIQMIKWLHEYGTVPGLANLHERYGFNSSWFTSISFFLPSSASINFYTALNGVISLWFSGYLITRLPLTGHQQEGKESSSFSIGILFIFLLSLLCWPLIRGNAATANYDFITSFLIVVLFIESIKLHKDRGNLPYREEWIIWPIYLFTVRITNYPLLLLSLYSLWFLYKEKSWQKAIGLCCMALGLVVPFISRNVILSGYAFYPAKQLNFFPVDWKVDEQTINTLQHFITYFNRVNTMFMDLHDTEKLAFPSWIPVWFRYLFSYDKLLFVPGIVGILLFFFKNLPPFKTPVHFFVFVIVLQLISWFLVAPDPRFVYGCLLVGVFLLVKVIIRNKMYIHDSIWKYVVAVPLALVVICYTMVKIIHHTEYRNFLLPYELPQPATTQVTVDGIRLSVPQKLGTNWNPRCYATDIPCLYIVHPKLKARGASIYDGFRIEK